MWKWVRSALEKLRVVKLPAVKAVEPASKAEEIASAAQKKEEAHISEGFFRSQEDIYKIPAADSLARACKKGDAESMYNMACFFRNRCTEPLKKLLSEYEANPCIETEQAVEKHLRYYFHEDNTAAAYMMWLVRAAHYGDDRAARLLEPLAYYRSRALIPERALTEGVSVPVGMSTMLTRAGFMDVPDGYDECSLRFDRETRRYTLTYLSDYEPPDEDGYGAEWEYDDLFFDEFFNRIPGK